MERYTLREGGRVLCPTERLEAALERLAAFEDLACGLEEEQQSISQRLEELRGQRKERTVQFRELLAQLNASGDSYSRQWTGGNFGSYCLSNPILACCAINIFCNCCCGRGFYYGC